MMKFSSKIEKKSTAGNQVSGEATYEKYVNFANIRFDNTINNCNIPL